MMVSLSLSLNILTLFQDPKPLIQFILALSFASREEMGYDPTVRRRKFEEQWVYDYQVIGAEGKETWYRTRSLIFSYQPLQIVGRAIRVWEVWVLGDDGKLIEEEFEGRMERRAAVLKDCWLTVDTPSELDTQQQILEAYKAAPDDERKVEDPENFFMTILHDTVVSAGGAADTSDRHFRDESHKDERGIPISDRVFELVKKAPHHIPKGLPTFDRPHNGPQRVYETRKHSRTVFDEVGERLDDINNQQVLIDCLADALTGTLFLR